jgi:hypothetical protein
VRLIFASARLTVQRNRPFFFRDSAAKKGISDQQQCAAFGVPSREDFELDQCFSVFFERVGIFFAKG